MNVVKKDPKTRVLSLANCISLWIPWISSDASLTLLELSLCGFFFVGLEQNGCRPFSPSAEKLFVEEFEML